MTAVHCPSAIRQLWLYRRVAPATWQVGFFDPDGGWQPETDHTSPDGAADRVHWLNGSPASMPVPAATDVELAALHAQLQDLDERLRECRSLAIRRARKARQSRRGRRGRR